MSGPQQRTPRHRRPQSWWVLQALLLFATEARNARYHRQQIYARPIFGQLRLLRLCARMQADELESLGASEVVRDRPDPTIEEFDIETPDALAARNMLEHFDDYARGKGVLQKRAIRKEGLSVYEAAAVYWGGGYDPVTERITEGPNHHPCAGCSRGLAAPASCDLRRRKGRRYVSPGGIIFPPAESARGPAPQARQRSLRPCCT